MSNDTWPSRMRRAYRGKLLGPHRSMTCPVSPSMRYQDLALAAAPDPGREGHLASFQRTRPLLCRLTSECHNPSENAASKGPRIEEPDVPRSAALYQSPESRAFRWSSDHLRRRTPAVWASTAFFVAGLIYFFWWGLHVDWGSVLHRNWNSGTDIWLTFQIAGDFAHGHLSSVYSGYHFESFPGIAFLLAPVAALASALHLSVDIPPSQQFVHPQAWVILGPILLLLSTVPLFAFDALAQRLGADRSRRLLLAFAQGVALWSVLVFWGHPEDAMAVGLLAYAYLFSLDGRWNGAAWLFGIAVALQPLVLAVLPILLAIAGIMRWSRFVLRAVIPGLAVILGPLITNFHLTFTAFTQQPSFPLANHETPWTALAPRVNIGVFAVAGGPGRVVSLVLACAVGWWSIRWRGRPEMLVWAASLALALRCFTESVMDPYYLWPALALAMVASVRTHSWRFGSTLASAVLVTVTSQWHLAWGTWWVLNSVGLAVVLICSIPVQVVELHAPAAASGSSAGRERSPHRGGTAARKATAKGQRSRKPSRR